MQGKVVWALAEGIPKISWKIPGCRQPKLLPNQALPKFFKIKDCFKIRTLIDFRRTLSNKCSNGLTDLREHNQLIVLEILKFPLCTLEQGMPGTQELVHGTERGDRASFSSELTNARRIFPRDKGTVAAALLGCSGSAPRYGRIWSNIFQKVARK